MIKPDNPGAAGAKSSTGHSAACVPTKALEIDGTAPAVGDEVEFTAKGRVSRVEGDKTYVEVTAANGEPVPTPAAATEPDADDVMRAARDADKEPLPA